MTEPIILSRAYPPIDPTEIEKIVLEVLVLNGSYGRNTDIHFGSLRRISKLVAREVAERLSATREI